jgi:ABC-type polar amino acid transport system ATPase subunit
MLAIDCVTKRWSDGTLALEDISFEAMPGTLTAVIGPSGAGKTVLLRTVCNLERCDSGEIRNPYGQPSLVFQEPSLWPHLTLLKNVSLPLRVLKGFNKHEARRIAAKVLSDWGLEDRLGAFPAELSGGQQQRGALARALVVKPKILCLDEVTSALDPETAAFILKTLLSWRSADTIILMSTHQLHFVKAAADQVVFIDHGRLVEKGPVSEILAAPAKARTQAFVAAATAL